MLLFSPPQFEDKEYVEKVIAEHKPLGCDFSFAQLWQWAEVYNTQICRFGEDGLIVRVGKGEKTYLCPMRGEKLIKAAEALIGEEKELVLVSVEEDQKDLLLQSFPEVFSFEENRDHFDYIYNSADLIGLSGKKYHAKRNHISRFLREYPDAVYEPICEGNIEACIETEMLWLGQTENTPELAAESKVIIKTLRNIEKLGLVGGIIKVGKAPVAMSIGQSVSEELFVVHFEKALKDYPGAYALINREFAKANCSGHKYINREEDLGKEGLRKAKLSYYPEILLKKYTLRKGENAV